MRSAASRLHKGFSYERRFAACEAYAVKDAAAWAGQWAYWAPGGAKRAEPFAHVVLDLGCGKGEYTVACAQARPDVLFVGFDVDAICTLRSAEQAASAGVDNAVFLLVEDPFAAVEDGRCALAGASGAGGVPALAPIDAHASRASRVASGTPHRSGAPAELDLARAFAAGELACILMNFPTPFPKKKKAHLRLTHLDRLMGYRRLLREGAGIRLRTDSQPLRDFSLTQFELAGYRVARRTDDVRAACPDEPWSAYERKLVEQGARALGVFAVPGPAPAHVQQTAPLSLVSYFPDNLDALDYVPHGMQGCVENLRNRHAHERARGVPEFRPPAI
ncbi:tRNA (guanosine(46)-N(7))-methyltransferase TrmB [uncultured Senegalimassilia sp.]|uniref:tRNA (guanine(46)-N(7))-methyltransferase TrmB n=1 Tax=uncultured Senegalimassilia sp. TaxID=1714350 RepID=UPI0026DFB1C8|nr:methyltransferase [uncultured Senegalimassilia sp.]